MTDQQNIKNQIEKPLINDLSKEQLESFKTIQNHSKRFINIINRAYNKTIRNTEHLQKITYNKSAVSNSLQYFYLYMRQSTELTRVVTTAQFQYENALNAFLQRTITLTWYNYEDGELYYFNEIGARMLYESATANFGRGNISISQKKLQQIQKQGGIDETMKNLLAQLQNTWKPVLQKALERWNDKNNTGHFYYHDGSSERHYSDKFSKRGFIIEGYVRAIVNNTQDFNGDIEHGLKILSGYASANSKGGAVEGDVVAEENGNLNFSNKISQQFASKSYKSFSTEKVGQYLAIAEAIKKSQGLTPQYLKNMLNNGKLANLDDIASRIFKTATKRAEKAVEEYVQSSKRNI